MSNYINPRLKKTFYWVSVLFMAAILAMTFPQRTAADDNDPPVRVARLSYLQGSVSFQPAIQRANKPPKEQPPKQADQKAQDKKNQDDQTPH
jgi:hypothetical protein